MGVHPAPQLCNDVSASKHQAEEGKQDAHEDYP